MLRVSRKEVKKNCVVYGVYSEKITSFISDHYCMITIVWFCVIDVNNNISIRDASLSHKE